MADRKPIYATAAILVEGVHHDIGDRIETSVDDEKMLLRLRRADQDGKAAAAARAARAAVAEAPAS